MLERCPSCPSSDELAAHLESLLHSDWITYKQWMHTDRANLVEISEPVPQFIEKLVQKLKGLLFQSVIAKKQANCFRELKGNLKPGECSIHLDLSENYSFVIQDAVQSFSWTNSQATIHQLCAYYRDSEKMVIKSYCVIGDHLSHDATAVNLFLSEVVRDLKRNVHNLTKIYYFSDGGQSFAAQKASLQRDSGSQIDSPYKLFEWAKQSALKNSINVIWVAKYRI